MKPEVLCYSLMLAHLLGQYRPANDTDARVNEPDDDPEPSDESPVSSTRVLKAGNTLVPRR